MKTGSLFFFFVEQNEEQLGV